MKGFNTAKLSFRFSQPHHTFNQVDLSFINNETKVTTIYRRCQFVNLNGKIQKKNNNNNINESDIRYYLTNQFNQFYASNNFLFKPKSSQYEIIRLMLNR